MSRVIKYTRVLALLLVIGFVCVPVLAKGKQGQSGKSNISHRDLDAQDGSMSWGKIKFNISGDTLKFVFNGHELEPGTEYVLKTTKVILGTATANESGDVHIAGTIDDADALMAIEANTGRKFNLRITDGDPGTLILRSEVYEFDYTGS